MTRASARIAEIVASIEKRLDEMDCPLYVRVRDGQQQIGQAHGRRVLWAPVQSLSAYMLERGFGRRPVDDDIPF